MSQSADVVIGGAGIAGLALALGLADAGMSVHVVERGARPKLPDTDSGLAGWDARVSALTAASTSLLDHLGVWDDIAQVRVGPYQQMSVWDAEGTGHINFSAAQLGASTLGHIVENRLIINALLAGVDRRKRITVSWDDGVSAVDVADGAVNARLASGAKIEASLLVGADGGRSTIRELVSLPVRAWSYDQHAIVGTVELEASHEDTCYQAFLSTGPLALLPLADKALCSIVWSLDNDIWENLMSASDDDFVAQINRALGPNCPEVLAVGPRAAFPLHQCHAVDYIARRVALVGDAAHAIHPLAGQGINLGLKDVAALAGELEQAWSSAMDVGSSEALKRFQRVRKTDNLAMMAAMEGFKRGFGSVNPAVRVLRNLGLNWVNQAGWLRDWFARQAVS